MDYKRLKRLVNMIPQSEKKEDLLRKLESFNESSDKGQGGLHDKFPINAKGHISIEEIDSEGNVIGVLADQDNLVVEGSEEILLRAFSGDTQRVLYKNRVLKNSASSVYHADLKDLIVVENGANIVACHPNEIWKLVDEDEFDYEYSYYPNILYVAEETSTVPGMKAFRIYQTVSSGRAPLTAELYSAFTNTFIGLGDGLNYKIPLDHKSLTYSGDFTGETKKETRTDGDEIRFKEKISNFVVEYETHTRGGEFEVYLNNDLIATVETTGVDGEKKEYAFGGLSNEVESEIRVKFIGSTEVEEARLIFRGIRFDALFREDNYLIGEFENFTLDFKTPDDYSTTETAPYKVQLENFPVRKDTIEVTYNETVYVEKDSKEGLEDGEFFVDYLTGEVYFNKALTNIQIAYGVTGQVFDSRTTPTMQTKNLSFSITKEIPTRDANNNAVFYLQNGSVTASQVYRNGNLLDNSTLPQSQRYNLNNNTGRISFNSNVPTSDVIEVSYDYTKVVNTFNVDYVIDPDQEIVMYDSNGKELAKAVASSDMSKNARFSIDTSNANGKALMLSVLDEAAAPITGVKVYYYSKEKPGVETGYRRGVVLKPKDEKNYPWFSLDKGSVTFVAEFDQDSINHNVTIREMGLFNGPRKDDHVKGFTDFPVKAFSLVRVGDAKKDRNTGLRVSWTITLTDEDGIPFKG